MSERTFHFFHHKHATLHYSIYGSGSKPILCFHGFGLTGKVFYELEEQLCNEYTFYNFDLFFHGKSEWKAREEPLSEKVWSEMIDVFTKEKNIISFSLLGYSIGAKSVWSIVKNFPDRVKEIIVLAPDGIPSSSWYIFATGTVVTRFLFKRLLFNKTYITTFLEIGRRLKIVPSITARFAESQLITYEQRQKVYYTWMVYRKLKIDTTELAKIINQNNIKLTIYLGKYDKIITSNSIQKLVKKTINKNIVIVEAGHSNLISKVKEHLSFS